MKIVKLEAAYKERGCVYMGTEKKSRKPFQNRSRNSEVQKSKTEIRKIHNIPFCACVNRKSNFWTSLVSTQFLGLTSDPSNNLIAPH